MRLDKFLQLARLVRNRTGGKTACEEGLVRVNGRPGKAAHEVVEGDTVEVTYPDRARRVEILLLPARGMKKAEAKACVREISTTPLGETPARPARTQGNEGPGAEFPLE